MYYLLAYLAAVASPIVWLLNAEAIAVLSGLSASRPVWLVALVLTAGQVTMFTALYFGGDRLLRRIGPLRRQIDRLAADPVRLERWRRRATATVAAAALVGLPPMSAFAAIAPALGVRYRTLALVATAGRGLRFLLLASLPQLFAGWFPVESLPEWLR